MVETSGVEIYLLSGGTEIAYIIAKYIYKMLLTCRQHAACAHSVTNHLNKTSTTQQPSVGQVLLIFEASRSHSGTPRWVGLLYE